MKRTVRSVGCALALVAIGGVGGVGCGGGAQGLSAAGSEAGSLACGQTVAGANFRGLVIGSVVRLRPHTEWRGDTNWADDMAMMVGMATTVTQLAGVDASGCPAVRVEADGGTFAWRVRDLEVLSQQPVGRDRCGQSPEAIDYLGLQIGAPVRIGRHRSWYGDDNWATQMDAYVGREARIMDGAGIDAAGCPVVRVDIDQGTFAWRARDLTPTR